VGIALVASFSGCGPAELSNEEPGGQCVPMSCAERACGATDGCGTVCATGCIVETSAGALIPFYVQSGDPGFDRLIAAKRRQPTVPVTVIVNPATGPGTARFADLGRDIKRLTDEAITVLGYVPTAYGQRPFAEVQADLDRYRSFYPELRGIFFDEMRNTAGGEDYYRDLSAHARSLGLTRTVGNPGADTLPSYVGTVDVLVIHGGKGAPSREQLGGWHASHDRKGFAALAHTVDALPASFVDDTAPYVGHLYATDDVEPNPWDSLPPYLDGLIDALGR
jgi:hypothetical protein